MHLSEWAVAADDVISKGDLIGYTGEIASGFDHLHFELRDAPSDDVLSRWQRDSVHTLFHAALPGCHLADGHLETGRSVRSLGRRSSRSR